MAVASGDFAYHNKLIDWVRSKGGYWNPKQELRSEDGLYGVFSTQDINEGEILASIPWSSVIEVPFRKDRFDNCDIVERLAKEMEKGDESNYSLYVQELVQTAKQHSKLLPSYWTAQGQELLLKIIGNGALPPLDPFLLKNKWKQSCEHISKEATLLVLTHGESFGMVPITDKYNSRGGNYTGAFFSIEGQDELALEIRAYRNVKAGEQIFTDYRDYGKVGTAELLRDYGFIEFYPQRWIFPDQEIAFDIIRKKKMTVHWRRRVMQYTFKSPIRENAQFQENTLQFLNGQLERLETDIHPILMQHLEARSLPELESEIIHKFYTDLTIALQLAINDIKTKIVQKESENSGEELA
eukprot:CAMPEP_0178896642 /NCGR_PEP_ID=MMETSP0786-20121207/1294_1 /TAXON_ID=186022 /ORGANISM="Thalassionema frauenfeldii, Strain CCMP 1798" /LENGTH=353 /DNA_ID=CAMNT_0020567083 /DNA_START=76 /DNA_END=1134 /DNA_ORIENTATION=+